MFFVGLVGVGVGLLRGLLNDSDAPSRGVWIWCIGGGGIFAIFGALGVWLIRMG